MGTNVRQGIVTSGLTLHIDMANPLSYPGSGTSITSLVRNGVTGSISGSAANIGYSTATGNKAVFWNNPFYNANIGNILLTSDVFNVGTNPFTLEMLWYPTARNTSGLLSLATNADSTVAPIGYFNVFVQNTGLTPGVQLRSAANVLIFGGNLLNVGQWHHICIAASRGAGSTTILYNNAIVVSTGADPGNISSTVGSSAIGRNAGGGSNVSTPYGHMAITRFYNRALSATEVRQNYNAVKSRFNLP